MLKKIIAGFLMLVLSVCLMACGSDKEEEKSDKKDSEKNTENTTTDITEEPTPEEAKLEIATTETWGDYTVGVPTEWEFRKGDFLDENDTRYCSVKKSDFKYFDLKMEEEQVANNQYNYNKNTYTNEQEDISVKYGDIDWTGFQYSDGWGGYGFELIATVNEKPVRVSSCGFKYDSEEAKLVLGSLIIK
ncbi:MAG: hypothetical protein IKS98_06520 [Lachnospiraceae bacterium]|nr:hypothetical protein [Lachnospiraceae bacterium]